MNWDGFIVVAVVGLCAPLIRGLAPAILIPAVLEFLAGMVLGPSVLDWIRVEAPIEVFATIGVTALLFLAGKEIRLEQIRGRVLTLSLLGTGCSVVLALAAGGTLALTGLAEGPLLIAIALVASSLAVIIPA